MIFEIEFVRKKINDRWHYCLNGRDINILTKGKLIPLNYDIVGKTKKPCYDKKHGYMYFDNEYNKKTMKKYNHCAKMVNKKFSQ